MKQGFHKKKHGRNGGVHQPTGGLRNHWDLLGFHIGVIDPFEQTVDWMGAPVQVGVPALQNWSWA